MRAGTLRHKILIETVTETQNTFGEPVSTWATFATLRARKAITGGREFIAALSIHSELSALFVCRFYPGVTTKMRVNHGGVYYDILAAFDPVGLGRELQIACKEVK